MQIPFARQTYSRTRAFTPEATLVNFIVEPDASSAEPEDIMLVQRPGLTRRTTLPATVSGIVRVDGGAKGIYAISDNALFSITDTTTKKLGDVSAPTGQARFAYNFDRLLILCGSSLYLYGATTATTANSFRAITLPDDGYDPVDITAVDDYFVVACKDGTYLWLIPGEDDFSGAGDALHFATAQSDPDGLVGITTLNGNIAMFGSNSVEFYQVVGSADQPFQRLIGQDYARGCLTRDTIQKLDNAVFWVGDDRKVYRTGQVPQRISTFSIEERIRLASGPLSAWTFDYDGHLFYVLRLGSGTFAYDVASKTWSEFRSEGAAFWRAWVGCSTADGALCADSQSGAIWMLSDASTDDGAILRRSATAIISLTGKPVRVDNIALDVGSEQDCTWRLRWGDGDEGIGDQPWVELPARRGSDVLTLYRLGQAVAPYRQFEVEITDPVGARLSGARVGEAWR